VSLRLAESERVLAASLLLPIDPNTPMAENSSPDRWEVRLGVVLKKLAERDRRNRLRDLEAALNESSETNDPVAHRALWTEYMRLLNQRLNTQHSYV
jgi:hypothetical protein